MSETLATCQPPPKALWSLEPDTTFLNHGAFGATPIELLDLQNVWRSRMEAHPSRFFMAELQDHILAATAVLAAYIGADAEQTVMVENATSGMGAVLNSIRFLPGDKIVTTNHVYNAVRNILRHVSSISGAEVIEVELHLPVASTKQILDSICSEIDARTRLVVIDHITSPTALIMPVIEIVAYCHKLGVPVLIDGSHAPGMIELDVEQIGADWYVGNCHKWLCAPKGAAFLVARKGAEKNLHPSIISHAYEKGFKAEFGKIGTRDASAWLCVPAAIEFHQRLGGSKLKVRNSLLAAKAGRHLIEAFKTQLAGPLECFAAMVSIQIPGNLPATPEVADILRNRLWEEQKIDVLILPIGQSLWLRFCIHAYNAEADISRLSQGLLQVIASIKGE